MDPKHDGVAHDRSLGTRPNGLSGPGANSFAIRQEGRRPLFASAATSQPSTSAHAKPQDSSGGGVKAGRAAQAPPWRTKSETHAQKGRDLPLAPTLIPQPSHSPGFPRRRPLSLADALRIATEEEENEQRERDRGSSSDHAMDASPSPAPKMWRRSEDRRQDAAAKGTPSLSQRHQPLDAKVSPSRRTNNNASPAIPPLVPGVEDLPLPSVENGAGSPGKSFAWDIDEDFTAGDLQVSDSPRLKTSRPFANRLPVPDSSNIDLNSRTRLNPGSQNTKLDKIRARENRAALDKSANATIDQSQTPSHYQRLKEVRALEQRAESDFPATDRLAPRPPNTKLDEVLRRERDGLSPRALAQVKIAEIREKNSASRSKSPEEPRTETERTTSRKVSDHKYDGEAEAVEGTPVTIYKRGSRSGSGPELNPAANDFRPAMHQRNDSKELLRRLARVTSISPKPSTDRARPQTSPPKIERVLSDGSGPSSRGGSSNRSSENGPKRSNFRGRKQDTAVNKPTVEFAGLRRVRSAESTESKRSSMHSEADPTDRILGEQRLFALQDNYSERGSTRAPSPPDQAVEEDDKDGEDELKATPKASRAVDPLSMPTPKVTGAYVDTPVTAKIVSKVTESGDVKPGSVGRRLWQSLVPSSSIAASEENREPLSDPGEDDASTRMAIQKKRRPRSQSHSIPRPRPRPTVLKNSALLPSVKDDMRELKRLRNMEDSTLDDLEQILNKQKPALNIVDEVVREVKAEQPQLQKDVEDSSSLPKSNIPDDLAQDKVVAQGKNHSRAKPTKVKPDDLSPDESKTEGIDRMSNIIASIRDSKNGIGRIGDQFTRIMSEKHPQAAAPVASPPPPPTSGAPHEHCPTCANAAASSDKKVTYVHIAVPFSRSLLRRLFFFLFLPLATWFLAESAMCAAYCRPETCGPSSPCIWSFDDPTFGTALPVKLDQWATNGHGRVLVNWAYEEAQDWIADVADVLLDRAGPEEQDTSLLTTEQRRRQKRRLLRHRRKQRGHVTTTTTTSEDGDGEGVYEFDAQQRAKMEGWRRARLARERVREAREGRGFEYEWDEDDYGGESLGGRDRRVW